MGRIRKAFIVRTREGVGRMNENRRLQFFRRFYVVADSAFLLFY